MNAVLPMSRTRNAVNDFVANLARDWVTWALSSVNRPRPGDLSDPDFTAKTASRRCPRTLCVGIGSPYGDDQVGWRIVQELAQLQLPGVEARQASSPSDVLDWLDQHDRLIICDACRGAGPVGSVHRWVWPCPSIAELRSATSHAIGIAETLSLAASLGRLPAEVVVWGVEAAPLQANDAGRLEAHPHPHVALSELVAGALPDVVHRIRSELCHA